MLACVGVGVARDLIHLEGRVKESLAKTDLTNAYVLLYDSTGVVCDTVRANQGYTYRGGMVDTLSNFFLRVPRVDSTFVFDVMCDGYQTQTVTYELSRPGKHERWRKMPIVYLERAPRMLNEVTVTSSKIKFYNKGDTMVYDASAFQLAEGSMLDALIAQLPGVELSSDGQIKVNGQFVESLLLNGKEFMDGNNNLMLENIAAYTVKNVQVYEGQKRQARIMGDISSPKVLTMDVRLKKEYNIGWILNAQGGYGTDGRYIGKVFASWFNPTTRVSLVGNVNNLNDNRKPGRNDTWTPEQMPTGTKEHRMAGLNYNYSNPEETRNAEGNVMFEQVVDNTRRTSARTNFLPGGDTYENAFGDSHRRETSVSTAHNVYIDNGKGITYGMNLAGNYRHVKNSESNISGAFGSEQNGMTAEILDAIYSAGTPEQLDAIINRSKTRSDGWSRRLSGRIGPSFSFKIPRSEHGIFASVYASYSSDKEELWRDYDINFGRNEADAVRRRQYVDNSPNHTFTIGGRAGYRTNLGKVYMSLNYNYSFTDCAKDSYMYALERLNDMGVYGVVPTGYLAAFDPANSYKSRTLENRHALNPYAYYSTPFAGNSALLMVSMSPEVALVHRHLDYWRDNRDYRLSTTDATLMVNSIWNCMVEMLLGKQGEGRATKYRHSVRYSYRIEPTLPELTDMVDVINDADPLNIYVGNPELKSQIFHKHLFRWSYSPFSHTFNNIFYLGIYHRDRALQRGYTYDTSTGVRRNKMYNVDGNREVAVTNEVSWQFGRAKQFTLASSTDAAIAAYTDMIGVNMEEPEQTKVRNKRLSENLKLMWNVGGQTLQLRCDLTLRQVSSTEPGFRTLNSRHVNYGVSGVFRLPAGFGISTDLMCYTRRGYGLDNLDTTDPIWNMRLSYCPPRNTRWVIMLDGFDLLHKLSNVNYAVTATGRTVSYTNALPRYVLLSVQYRLNIQPKKR